MGDFEIRLGDIVRLREPFNPEYFGFQKYNFAIVAGLVVDELRKSKNYQPISGFKQIAEGYRAEYGELVVYLYEPDNSTIYMDEFGIKPLFSFSSDEVELCDTPLLEQRSLLVRQ